MKITSNEIVEIIKNNLEKAKWDYLKKEYAYPETIDALNKIFEEENYSWEKEITYAYFLDEGFIDLIIIDVLKKGETIENELKSKYEPKVFANKELPNPYDYDDQEEYKKVLEEIGNYNDEAMTKNRNEQIRIDKELSKRDEALKEDSMQRRALNEKHNTDWQQDAYKLYAKEQPIKARVLDAKDRYVAESYKGFYYRAIPIVDEKRIHIKN